MKTIKILFTLMTSKHEIQKLFFYENNQTLNRQKINATLKASKLKDLKQNAKQYSVIGIDEGQFVSFKVYFLYKYFFIWSKNLK